MVIDQLIPSFMSGDAMGQAALHFQRLLRRLGHDGNIYAGEIDPNLNLLALPASQLTSKVENQGADWVFYHHGIASSLSSQLLLLKCKKGLIYHNITPARFYRGTALEEALISGRAQLAAMAPEVNLAIGVSQYNRKELDAAGYQNTHYVPLFVEPARFLADNIDAKWLNKFQAPGAPTVLSVSRTVAHKRVEDLIALHSEMLRLNPLARLWVVGGYEPGGRYFKRLQKLSRGLPGIVFFGRLSHAKLVACYRAATVFVSMSEHEGFGVPLVESMASELPVIAFDAGAVKETMGGRGIVFTQKQFPFLADLIYRLHRDPTARQILVEGQLQRLKDFSVETAQSLLKEALPIPAPSRPKAPARLQIGIIVQRYAEHSGGAEAHAAQLARRFSKAWDVTVLTSCAANHLTWENAFAAGETAEGAVRVIRFPVLKARRMDRFNRLSKDCFSEVQDLVHEEHWLAEQGPLVPGLIDHLAREGHRYNAFVAFTYLYAPTVWGLPLVAKKTLMVPTAHDEPPLRFRLYDEVFELPRVLMCNTPEEEALIRRRFPRAARSRVVGVGVEAPSVDARRFRLKFGIEGDYLFYVGRLEEGKGIAELLTDYHFLRGDLPQLILAGTSTMNIRQSGVRTLGRIDDQDKFDGLAGALATVIPSRYESLSLLALESFASRTPVLANGASEVLAGQVQRSRAGAIYNNRMTFIEGLRQIRGQRDAMSQRAGSYARSHSWEKVMSAYQQEVEKIRGQAS